MVNSAKRYFCAMWCIEGDLGAATIELGAALSSDPFGVHLACNGRVTNDL
jgi:hypothetical protein